MKRIIIPTTNAAWHIFFSKGLAEKREIFIDIC
jgi:hypothetical protein